MAKQTSLLSLFKKRRRHIRGEQRASDMQDTEVKYALDRFITENFESNTKSLIFECSDPKFQVVLVDLIFRDPPPWPGYRVEQVEGSESLYRVEVEDISLDEEF